MYSDLGVSALLALARRRHGGLGHITTVVVFKMLSLLILAFFLPVYPSGHTIWPKGSQLPNLHHSDVDTSPSTRITPVRRPVIGVPPCCA